MSLERRDWTSRRTVPVFNITAETIPGYACMAIARLRSGVNFGPQLVYKRTQAGTVQLGQAETPLQTAWIVMQPDENTEYMQNPYQCIFNGPTPIPPQEYGTGTMDWPAQALFQGDLRVNDLAPGSAGGTQLAHTAGPRDGSWQLHIGGSAFTVLDLDFSSLPNPPTAASLNSTTTTSAARIWVAPLRIGRLRCQCIAGVSYGSIATDVQATLGALDVNTILGGFERNNGADGILVPAAGTYKLQFHGHVYTTDTAAGEVYFTRNGTVYSGGIPGAEFAHPIITGSVTLEVVHPIAMNLLFPGFEQDDEIGIKIGGTGDASLDGVLLIEAAV